MFSKFTQQLAFLALLLSSLTQASTFESMLTDPLDGRFDASSFLAENAYGFLPIPIIITDPAVKGGLGLTGLFFHETEEEQAKRQEAMRNSENAALHLLPPSVSFVAAVGTGNKSYLGGGGHLGFFNEGRIRYLGFIGYGDINLDFYGLPDFDDAINDILSENPLSIKTKAGAIIQHVKFQIADTKLFLGPKMSYIDTDISLNNLSDYKAYCSTLPPQLVDGCNELIDYLEPNLTASPVTSGLGLIAEWDSRDNFFSPRKGYNVQTEYLIYDDLIGSDIDYNYFMFKSLNYWPINKHIRTNLRLDWQAAYSDTPLPTFTIPGMELRGLPMMKYQGERVAVSELELVWQIDLRWNVSVFGGSGRAAKETSGLKDAPSRTTKGIGFRYQVARRYGFDMGIDIAKGPEDEVFYIQAGSAW